jgi:hypothetical protein
MEEKEKPKLPEKSPLRTILLEKSLEEEEED